jgi:hypothetical protein
MHPIHARSSSGSSRPPVALVRPCPERLVTWGMMFVIIKLASQFAAGDAAR